MKYISIVFISLISLVSFAQEIQPDLKGWAKNSVNTVVFRNNSLVSFDTLQFMAYYDDEGFLCLAKRVLNSTTWTMKKTAYKGNVQDAHNCISIMVDGDGYLHVAWNHHNSPLNYTKSRDAQLGVSTSLDLEEKQAMTGQQENKLTYPGFYKLSNGNLLFLYREGGSGNGNLVVNTYDIHTKKWTQLHDNLVSGEGFRNAYWQACTDTKGNIHLSWVWRETPDVATNHDMCYARSTDGGKTWINSKGKKYALPITEKSAEYAAIIPQKSELINQTSMTADNAGNPYIATYYRKPDSQIPQYHIIFLKNNKWRDVSLDFRKTPFSLSGGGTKKIPIARPQILFSNNAPVLIFRDEERGSKVSIAICENFPRSQWRITDVTDYSVGDWEPTYDTELWKTRQQLDVFIQKTEQKDNEGTAEIAAQPVSVLNIPWIQEKEPVTPLLGKQAGNKYSDYPIQQVNLNYVTLTDAFWLPKIQTIQKKTIQYAFDKCDSEGRFENFITAGKVMNGGTGKTRGVMPFDDTDVYKTIEGAAYSLISAPDPELENYLDSIIAIVKTGQEPDGYLTTWRTIDPGNPPAQWVKSGGGRWFDLGSSHELYNSGHLFEAATAHYWATGKRNFLDIAIKNADLLVKVFGDSANYEIPGHQIAETGLIKLYQITDNEDYLKLAKKFLDLRGDAAHRHIRGAYSQDHLPVAQQDEVVGHAVRAVYMYAGMTDIAAIYGEKSYLNAVNNLWNNMVNKKLYITGGIGARHDGESFGDNYELPNLTAYSETCAAIGSVYWNDRLFRLTGNSKYYDILERTLYNALIAGISLEGTEFFYPNPLESDGKYKFNAGVSCTRHAWFDCSCCPTNLIRFIPYIPNLIYATEGDNLYVNLFMSNKAAIPVQGKTVDIQQETNYPWQGNINLNVKTEKPQKFTLKIRIPGWAKNEVTPGSLYTYSDKLDETFQVLLNGSSIQTQIKNGYIEISKEWTGDNRIELILPMKVRQVAASQDIVADRGLSSIEYGPLVYCVEEIDNRTHFDQLSIQPQARFSVAMQKDLLDGVNVIYEETGNDKAMFVPYYAWANRGINKMKVWLPTHNFREWAQTPPMGWNSWDCYGPTVEEHEVKANADYMAKYLKKYGWEYIVVDIRWFVENDKAGGYNQTDPRYVLDEYGRYQPAVNRFPSAADNKGFKPLADYVHSKGLKFGIHIMRGIPKEAVARKLPIRGTNGITADQIYSTENQCTWLRDNYTIVKGKPGAQEYYNSIMELYASWGVDFIKIDDLSAPIYHEDEVDMIRKAIDLTGRPIVLSTSPGETPIAAAEHVSAHANMWRMVNDVWDVWRDLPHLMKVAQDWYPYIAPGTWPDCDMIPLGRISIRGERGEDRMTRLTKEEQYSLMTFFTILRSPLMFGGDLPSNDKFTLSLLTNKEILKMHRESSEVRQLFQTDDQLAITSQNRKTGERYLAIFNLNNKDNQTISVDFEELGIIDSHSFTDMWSGKKIGNYENKFSQTLIPHASKLYKLRKK